MQQRLLRVVRGEVVGGTLEVQDVCTHCERERDRPLQACKGFCNQQMPRGHKQRDQQAHERWKQPPHAPEPKRLHAKLVFGQLMQDNA